MPYNRIKLLHHCKPYSTLSRQQRWFRNKKTQVIDNHEEFTAYKHCWTNELLSSDDGQDDDSENLSVSSEELLVLPHISNTGSTAENATDTCLVESATDACLNNMISPDVSAEPEFQDMSTAIFSQKLSVKSTSDSITCQCSDSIQDIVSLWAIEELNVPKKSITRLLKKLNHNFNNIPKSYHGLLGKPQLEYEKMLHGEYCHFSNWTIALKSLLDFYFKDCKSDKVTYFLLINIDGLPLFHHSPDHKLYPILVSIYGFNMRPLCAGIYCSNKSKDREMPPPSILLPKFLIDLDCLFTNPICAKTKTFILGSKGIYVCDAPSRSSLKLIKSHSGYSACERCTVVGKYCKTSRHVCLLDCSFVLRTNESFQLQTDKQHHHGKSILCDFGTRMVSDFVLDYMHQCCLGTMKQLFKWWLGKRCNR